MSETRNIEDCIFCLDCGTDITELRGYKGNPLYLQVPGYFKPVRYCGPCIEKARNAGFTFKEGLKTSPAIEQLVAESEIASGRTSANQYF